MTFLKNFLPRFISLIGIFLFITPDSFSQGLKKPDYYLETGTAISAGKQTPFWLLSNQYGMLTPNKFNGWVKTGIHTSLSDKKIDYDYNLELVNRYSNKNEIYIHQAYLR